MEKVIETVKLTHAYSVGTPFERVAVKEVDFYAAEGEYVAIIGHTGSGKSTLIQHLNGLMEPTSGKVLFRGEDVYASKETTRRVRFKVGLVFQYPEYQLFEETVYKDIAFGPKNMGLDDKEIDRRVRNSLELVGMGSEYLEASPFDLSGGQKRRVAIAGVMAMQPEVLILDEPLAGLDPSGCAGICENIRAFRESTGATIIMITHDMEAAAREADRLCVMYRGTLALDGTPEEVFSDAARLESLGLDMPEITKLVVRLRSRGIDIPKSIYTVEDAVRAISALKGGSADA